MELISNVEKGNTKEFLAAKASGKVGSTIGAKEEYELVQMTASFLNMDYDSKLELTHKFYESKGLKTGFLPDYTSSESQLLPLDNILQRAEFPISTRAVTILLLEDGYLEKWERPSSEGYKHVVALSNKGLEFGENLESPYEDGEVEPQYHEHSFLALMDLIGVERY